KEAKESGRYAKDEDRRAVLRARLRLKSLRYQFGVANNFPQRYLKILSDPDAHSEDEVDPVTQKNTIKKVACRSEKANLFMRRLDEEMEKADQAN
ncbi:hypothetical protein O181_102049, partial [Austropuccinia psidii MF-1]|nr:hypothetical protein [Austropuccinia psidii MF-1]